MSHITNTKFLPEITGDYVAGYFFPRRAAANHRSQVAGQAVPNQSSFDKSRSAAGADRRSPDQRIAGRRSHIFEPSKSIADAPSNKYTPPVAGSWAKKKLTPLHLECEECHAIWDFDGLTLPFLTIFNSTHTGTPSMHKYTSGIPSPDRFSILSKCVFFGRFCFNDVHSDRSVFGIFNPPHLRFGESVWVLLSYSSESGNDVFSRHTVKLMHMVLFSPIDGQTAQAGSYLLSVDSSRKLPCIFSSVRQVIEAFKLVDQCHPILSLSFLAKFFDKLWHFWKRFTVKKFSCMVSGTIGSIASFSRTFSITVSAIYIILGKLSLSVGQTCRSTTLPYNVFCGFSVFQCQKPSHVGQYYLLTVTTLQKCYSYNPYWVTFVTFVTFVTPFSKKIKIISSTQKNPYIAAFYALTTWDNLIESIPDNRHIISDRGSWCKEQRHESRNLQGRFKQADIRF